MSLIIVISVPGESEELEKRMGVFARRSITVPARCRLSSGIIIECTVAGLAFWG